MAIAGRGFSDDDVRAAIAEATEGAAEIVSTVPEMVEDTARGAGRGRAGWAASSNGAAGCLSAVLQAPVAPVERAGVASAGAMRATRPAS